MKILYENKDLIFVVKPRGVASQPSPKGDNMVNILTDYVGKEVFCVHRLDTATGGVMVYAKNNKTASILSKSFAENGVIKEYLAVVKGNLPSEGEMNDFLWHDKIKNKSFAVKTKRKGAKEARLTYTVIDGNEERSLVRIKLDTGRTHQIRVQFSSRGFPLYGDGKYGGKSGMPLALWCCSLSISLSDGTTFTFSETPPEEEPIWKF